MEFVRHIRLRARLRCFSTSDVGSRRTPATHFILGSNGTIRIVRRTASTYLTAIRTGAHCARCSLRIAERLKRPAFPHIRVSLLIDGLITADPAIGHEIIERSLAEPEVRLREYFGFAVGSLLEIQPEKGQA
jgi:hypothetical protein